MATLSGNTIASTFSELLRLGNSTLSASAGTSHYIKDAADTNSALSINTTRVGIGTATPGELLSLKVDSHKFISLDRQDNENVDNVGHIGINAATSGLPYIWIGFDEGNVNEFVIRDDGNVGIGTVSPDGSLDISSTNAEIYVKEWSSSQTTPPEIKLQKNRGTSVDGPNDSMLDNTELGKISFWGWNDVATANQDEGASIFARVNGTPTNSDTDMPTELVFCTTAEASATPTERMYISSAGNVGIGCAAPTQLLEINAVTDADCYLQFSENGNGKWFMGNDATAEAGGGEEDAFVITNGGESGAEITILNASGNVGIGTHAPDSKLHVKVLANILSASYALLHLEDADTENDDNDIMLWLDHDDDTPENLYNYIQINDQGGPIGYLRSSTTQIDQQFTQESDIRFKENIVDTELKGLDTLNKVKVRDFEWNEKYGASRAGKKVIAGFIADELYEVYPAATHGKPGEVNDDGSIKSMGVMEGAFTRLLIKAVQELSAKVTALENA